MKITQLGDLVAIQTGKLDANASSPDGAFPFFTCSREPLKIDHWRYDLDAVLVAGNGDLNVKHYQGKFEAYQRTYILSVKGGKPLNTRYLYYFMDSYLDELRAQSIGGIIKYIKLGMLTKAPIPLPPLAEQRRIAAILDQADALRRARRRAIERLNDLGQAIFYEMFGDPVTNPRGWEIANLSDVCDVNPKQQLDSLSDNEVSFLPMTAVSDAGFILYEEKRQLNDVRKGYTYFNRGDVLVAKITPCFENGKACMTRGLENPVGFGSTEFHVLRPGRYVLDLFIFYIVRGDKFRTFAQEKMTGSAGQKRVPVSLLKDLLIPIPPIENQYAFQSKLEHISSMQVHFKQGLEQLETLFSSLQQRAFRGNL